MSTPRRVTVLGAAGGVGDAVTRELARRGHHVTAVSRRGDAPVPSGVTSSAADLADPAAAIAACQGADVVVMAAQVPYQRWADELPGLVDNALRAAVTADARLILVDNLYAYGSPGTPIGRDTPELATTRKGILRRDLARSLLAEHDAGRARVTVGRFSDYYGGHGSSLLDEVMVKPALRGRTPRAFISLDQPHTFHYLPDVARGLATLVEHPEADGAIWILPAAPAATQRQMISWLGEAIGRPLRAGRISPAMLWLAGLFDARLRESREVVPQFDRPYVTDARAFEDAFGPIDTTSHQHALRATVARLSDSGSVNAGT